MYQKVKAYMKEHGMVVDGDVVLAGVSGGGDSMAMLEMLKRYQAEATFSLCAVHVHHGIRGEEADRDERVVRETCEKWTIPFLSYHYPVPEVLAYYSVSQFRLEICNRTDSYARFYPKGKWDWKRQEEKSDRMRFPGQKLIILENQKRLTSRVGEESLPPEKENYGSVLLWPTMKMMWRKLCSTIFAEERG